MFGGKNSFFNKPFGTGKKSVAHNPLNISPVYSGRLGDTKLHDGGVEGLAKSTAVGRLFSGSKDKSVSKLSTGDIEKFMDKGEQKGETLTGSTMEEVGEGRADVRSRLQQILEGNSAGASALKQSQGDSQKSLKSEMALAGGGGQMGDAKLQEQKRQADMDFANFVSGEKRQALTDLSREFRGAGSDIMQSTGQYGSILVGAQPPAQAQKSNGLLSNLFSGIL